MKKISGKGNEITIHLPEGRTIQVIAEEHEQIIGWLDEANLEVKGNNNLISFNVDNLEQLETLLKNKGFQMMISGNGNEANFGKIFCGYMPEWGMMGLQLIIGNWGDRTVNNTKITIGDGTGITGAMIYLQDDNSHIQIGENCMISWGVNIWCTDAHTITDLEGNPTNFGRFIEIGNHVWVGRDVKIGKNVKIADNNIIGWGSIVTRSIEEEHVLAVGIPAKVVKHGVDWNHQPVSRYEEGRNAM